MLSLQVTYKSEAELMDFIYVLKMRGAEYKVKPPESEDTKTTKGGNKIRWIDIRHI